MTDELDELELDSQNQPEGITDEDDADVIREKFEQLSEAHKRLQEANKKLYARTKKAEGFELKDGKWIKPEKPTVEPKPEPKPEAKTGELDETQLDYLDLKGISDQDEIDIIQKVMAKTGQTVRQALQDDYVKSKLEALRQEKAVKNAMPGSNRRGSGQTDDLAQALAKFEQTGELPDDFALRSAVVNAKADRESTNKPSWYK
jgi:hypothetical protein